MRKKISIFALAVFLLVGTIFPAEANFFVSTLEVSGILVRVDESVSPREITLSVDGIEASGLLADYSEFMDAEGQRLELQVFVERYVGSMVTVVLYEEGGVVMSCRAN
jgi:hypothetical protein